MKHVIDRNAIRLTYTETYINNGKPSFIDELDWNVIETNEVPNYSFIKNKWNGSTWVEGATAEDLEAINQQQKNEISNEISRKVVELKLRALNSALGFNKDLSTEENRQFLKDQKEIYDRKANVANGVADVHMNQTITDQMELDYPNETDLNNDLIALGESIGGTKIVKYKRLIKKKNDIFYENYNKFIAYIESFRTITDSYLKSNEFEKANQVIAITTIPDEEVINDTLLSTKRAQALNL